MADPVALHYEESGSGAAVVLLHGYPLDHTLWRAQIAALSDAYRVIAPDLRGHGASPAPEGDYSMDLLAADVAALLDRLGVERAVWVGHSMGGYVALAALRTMPHRVTGLVLCASHPLADSPDKAASRRESAKQALRDQSVASRLIVLFGDLAFRNVGEPFAEGLIADLAAILGHETEEKGREVVQGSSSGYCSSMRNPEDTSFAGASSMRD